MVSRCCAGRSRRSSVRGCPVTRAASARSNPGLDDPGPGRYESSRPPTVRLRSSGRVEIGPDHVADVADLGFQQSVENLDVSNRYSWTSHYLLDFGDGNAANPEFLAQPGHQCVPSAAAAARSGRTPPWAPRSPPRAGPAAAGRPAWRVQASGIPLLPHVRRPRLAYSQGHLSGQHSSISVVNIQSLGSNTISAHLANRPSSPGTGPRQQHRRNPPAESESTSLTRHYVNR